MRARGANLAVAAFLLLVVALPALAAEQTAGSEPDWAYQLPYDLMSPFCPGLTLAACSSGQAAELRVWILLQAAAGASREEIEATLFERYGDAIRSVPRAEGWGATAFAVPIAALVLGGAVVAFVLRRSVTRAPDASQDAVPEPRVAADPEQPELGRRIYAEVEL